MVVGDGPANAGHLHPGQRCDGDIGHSSHSDVSSQCGADAIQGEKLSAQGVLLT